MVKVKLEDGGKVSGASSGIWSMINDNGMFIELDNGTRYIVFFRYEAKNGYMGGFYDTSKTNSICGKTMVGFVQSKSGQGNIKSHQI